ncbi:MAG: hypothetical protein ACLFN2_00840 [Bacteroidales bacterium]
MIKHKTGRVCFVILVFFTGLLFKGCSAWERKPFYEADISGVRLDPIRISRYETVLFELNPFELRKEITPHIEEFKFFLGEGLEDPEGVEQLYNYVTDPLLIELYNDSNEIWPDLDNLEESLTRAFRFYKYHFPESTIPGVYSYLSGIDYQNPVIYSEGHLIIALDTYLGSDYPYYEELSIPTYKRRWMRPERVPADVMQVLADEKLELVSPQPETLLEHMIHEGKRLFFLDCMLPDTPDSLKMKYTAAHQQWMENNQGRAWTYKLDNELLYSSDFAAIQKFIREAPFTAPFSQHSAPRTGTWLGWQIVREYMRRNQEISLQELLLETNAGKILNEARFRPD